MPPVFRSGPLVADPRLLRALTLAPLALLAACGDLPTDARDNRARPPVVREAEPVPSVNPISGALLYVDPDSRARRQVEAWRHTRPADAAQVEKIAVQPSAFWLGDWTPAPAGHVDQLVTRITQAGAVPVLVIYNIPLRDCGLYSAGGAAGMEAYGRWVAEVAQGIGSRRAVVIVEPDALASMDCLTTTQQEQRVQMIRSAVQTLKRSGTATVYVDAGTSRWQPAPIMAQRLVRAGLAFADGFSLNVSNFFEDQESIAYGEAVAANAGGKHFVIDTSRNGAGPSTPYTWCNPRGRALGTRPTTRTGHPLVDAFLWIKPPGESDGECNGGPPAGHWWAEHALELAKRS